VRRVADHERIGIHPQHDVEAVLPHQTFQGIDQLAEQRSADNAVRPFAVVAGSNDRGIQNRVAHSGESVLPRVIDDCDDTFGDTDVIVDALMVSSRYSRTVAGPAGMITRQRVYVMGDTPQGSEGDPATAMPPHEPDALNAARRLPTATSVPRQRSR
jgi:hypothetical protein